MSEVRATFLQSLDYEPDVFQVKAMNSIDADASVLVAAPTGSGKTLIADPNKGSFKSEVSRPTELVRRP